MVRGIGTVDRAEIMCQVGVWTVFCAPGDARPVRSLTFDTDNGRVPLIPKYVELGTTRHLPERGVLALRIVARAAALEQLGMVELPLKERDRRRWRVLALAQVADRAGEIHLAQDMPAAVLWSAAPIEAAGGGPTELFDVAMLAHLDSDQGHAYRRMYSGPGWLARYADSQDE